VLTPPICPSFHTCEIPEDIHKTVYKFRSLNNTTTQFICQQKYYVYQCFDTVGRVEGMTSDEIILLQLSPKIVFSFEESGLTRSNFRKQADRLNKYRK